MGEDGKRVQEARGPATTEGLLDVVGADMVEFGLDKPNKAPTLCQQTGAPPKGHDPLSESNSTKPCRGCGEILPLSAFARKGPGKLQTRCKDCAKAWVKRYREENPDKQKEADRRYRTKN